MLKNSFYRIEAFDAADSTLHASIRLQPGHPLYAGHFPGQPVVPGVCLMQIIKELIEAATGRSLVLTNARLMKFLVPIDPGITADLEVEGKFSGGEDGLVSLSVTILAEQTPCFSFSGVFGPLP